MAHKNLAASLALLQDPGVGEAPEQPGCHLAKSLDFCAPQFPHMYSGIVIPVSGISVGTK